MPRYLIEHGHEAFECGAVFASFQGFASPLRSQATPGSCEVGGHEIWWFVEAPDAAAALEMVPPYVASRSSAKRVGEVEIP
jgi:hypothetical protein